MDYRFRFSMCNEAFADRSFAEVVREIHNAGYGGIEIAPFTLAETPSDISAAQRKEYRDVMASEGVTFVGLHWLMVKPEGLHVTSPDSALRRRSWEHIRHLIDLAADLGPNAVMVFGSPKQRSTAGGLSSEEATRNFVQGLASVASHAESREVSLLVEALPIDQSDVVQDLAEATAIVHEIRSPNIQTMFDVHNAVNETEPHDVLIDRYFEHIRHVHVNELDGRHCGTGSYDYRTLLSALAHRQYAGWVSLEAFDFTPGPERIASESMRHLKSVVETLS